MTSLRVVSQTGQVGFEIRSHETCFRSAYDHGDTSKPIESHTSVPLAEDTRQAMTFHDLVFLDLGRFHSRRKSRTRDVPDV
jgi:hypothetical protein